MKTIDEWKSIVLIEDDEILAELLVRKLEKAGYRVELAKDGLAGVELVRSKRPDLVLLDMVLPKANGFDVMEKLHEEKILPGLPLVIISNSGQAIEIERAKKLGARDYLIKVNFDPNEVLAIVKRILKTGGERKNGGQGDRPEDQGPSDPPGQTIADVLIVEDDLFLVELLEKKLKRQNYKVFKAADAKQARTILEKNKIDAILLDVILPGMDGLTFLAEIKTKEPLKNIPVIIISNLGQQEEKDRGLKAGAADYIVKAHVTPGEIAGRIQEIIKKSKV